MEMNEQKKTIKYSIKKISILDFGIKDAINIKSTNQNGLFNFNIEFKISSNIENKIFAVLYNHRVQLKNEPKTDIGWLKIQIDFYIKDIKNFANDSEKQVVIPNSFLGNLFDHVISTARGVWATVMKGTKLENAIVPLINTQELVQKKKLDLEKT
ncbi:MAG: hypothetical protein H8E22_06030 [Candidatus Cloacimonetes bacterium]|nr:hypothetical protein [Candidatus Cloacimonadota bacterium]